MIKWVVRLAFVTVLLGIAGTLIIVTKNIKTYGEPATIVKPAHAVSIAQSRNTTNAFRDTAAMELATTNVVIAPKTSDTFSEKRPIKVDSKPAAKDLVDLQKKDVKKPIEKTAQKEQKKEPAAEEKANNEKLFNSAELAAIVARIYAVKRRHHFSPNCVQINVAPGKNKRAVSQIETYLRSHHFAIAGREEVSQKVKGIQLSPNNGCVQLTIGRF